jgi:hypothetical protein
MKKYREAVYELFDEVKGFEAIYPDNSPDDAITDDGFVHITRRGQRIVFYNGQGKGEYTDKDIPHFVKIVDKILTIKE